MAAGADAWEAGRLSGAAQPAARNNSGKADYLIGHTYLAVHRAARLWGRKGSYAATKIVATRNTQMTLSSFSSAIRASL